MEIRFVDADGLVRSAWTPDQLELEGLLGSGGVPASVLNLWLRPGDWAIDVGANVGLVTGQLCRRVGRDGVVWAFEPVPRNVRRLEELRRENDLKQLRVFDVAVGPGRSRAAIALPSSGQSGWASFVKNWDTRETMTVDVLALDDVIAESSTKAERVTFMKIDVEGFEPMVLQGAKRLLTDHRPVLYCEFNDPLLRAAGSSSADLLCQFESIGYRVVWRPNWAEGKALDNLEVVDLVLVHNSSLPVA